LTRRVERLGRQGGVELAQAVVGGGQRFQVPAQPLLSLQFHLALLDRLQVFPHAQH